MLFSTKNMRNCYRCVFGRTPNIDYLSQSLGSHNLLQNVWIETFKNDSWHYFCSSCFHVFYPFDVYVVLAIDLEGYFTITRIIRYHLKPNGRDQGEFAEHFDNVITAVIPWRDAEFEKIPFKSYFLEISKKFLIFTKKLKLFFELWRDVSQNMGTKISCCDTLCVKGLVIFNDALYRKCVCQSQKKYSF